MPKHKKLRLHDERLSSVVTDFDDYDPMDNLHCIGQMLFSVEVLFCSQILFSFM